jgi:hypothetical protein
MPLSPNGLCDAESTTPRSKSSVCARNATPGVGSTPALVTDAPCDDAPRRELALDPFAGLARVTAEHDLQIVRRLSLAHNRRAQPRNRLRIERPDACHTPHAIGSKESVGHSRQRTSTETLLGLTESVVSVPADVGVHGN